MIGDYCREFTFGKRCHHSNRTITGKFTAAGFIIVGDNGYVITPLKTQQVDNEYWSSITYGNGKYVMVGFNYGYISSSTDRINWTTPKRISQVSDRKSVV